MKPVIIYSLLPCSKPVWMFSSVECKKRSFEKYICLYSGSQCILACSAKESHIDLDRHEGE